MSTWEQWRAWIRGLIFPSEPVVPPTRDIPESLQPRVLLITFDPIIEAEGGRKLSEVLGWHDVDELCQEYITDLRECSKGFVEYQIVERIAADAWPVKADGFRYDDETFLRNWREGNGWHQPDWVDYEAIIEDFDLLKRVNVGLIDEVWLFAFPFAGFYESRMVGPNSFWCNSPELETKKVSRRFVIMGFNYERHVGPMLESFGHRTESILRHTWRHWRGRENLWEQFILYDKKVPGKANCGWMHYAPNSVGDYDWGNRTKVQSNCDDWLNFPNFRDEWRLVDCSDWGNGDMRAHHKWWFDRLPNAPGTTGDISNNWWWYAVDPNAVR